MPSSSSARRRAAATLLVLATAATTGACRVDVRVALDSDPDGGGTVRAHATLDEDAVTQLVGRAAGTPPDVDPATRIKVDDLRAAGWAVTGPTTTPDGGLEVVATHDYDDAGEAVDLLEDLGGAAPDGPFRDLELTQERGFFKTTTTFSGTVDLTAGLGAFTDPELREALAATPEAPLGITAEQLEQRFGATLGEMLGLRVDVRLPGDAEATTERPALGRRVDVEASAERWNVRNLVALAVATTSALALGGLLAARRLGRHRSADDTDDTAEA